MVFFNGRETGAFVKSTTFRPAAICVLLLAAGLDGGQTVTLTLSSVETHVNKTIRVELLLKAPSNSAPAGLQWIFRLPPGLHIIGIKAGTAVTDAGKTLVCNGAKCLVYGMNRTTISDGPIALLKIKVDQGSAGGKRSAKYDAQGRVRMRRPEIQIGDPIAVSLDGTTIPVIPGNGIVRFSKTP